MRLVTYALSIQRCPPRRPRRRIGRRCRAPRRVAAALPCRVDMLAFIDNGVTLLPALQALSGRRRTAAGRPARPLPLENVKLQAPIPRPRKNIFGIGLNYREHVAESSQEPGYRTRTCRSSRSIFSKPPTIGDRSRRSYPAQREDDAAARLGSRARRHHRQDRNARSRPTRRWITSSAIGDDRHSARATIAAPASGSISKGMDTYAPFGPCIVTADEIPDPHDLGCG